MKKAVIFFADGFEECEGLVVVDLLRRAGIEVATASVMGRKEITSSHSIKLQADCLAEEADYEAADIVILPGGMPGTKYLGESDIVKKQCLAFAGNSGKYIAAICAAPTVFAALGLLEGKEAICYPGMRGNMRGAVLSENNVAVSGNIITGEALGAAIPFALKIIEELIDKETAENVASSICY